MAYNKKIWVNDETELSAENLQYIEDGVYNNQNIEIIAISEDEPETYDIGDKYYNSEQKLIYTANENDWGVGETPIRGAFYLLLSEQSSYYFDGNDMISVGGGTEDILIQDEEPTTDDWKLWIDTGEVNNLGSEVVDTLSGNETNKAPSVRAVNGIIESGSNENGDYIKYSDGTMICTRECDFVINISNAWGSLYYGENGEQWYFAIPFISTPKVIVDAKNTGTTAAFKLEYNEPIITNAYYQRICMGRPNERTAVPCRATILAIGRWK